MHLADASEILCFAQDDISARCANVFLQRGMQKRNQATMKATWLIGYGGFADFAALSIGTPIRGDPFLPQPFDTSSSVTERDRRILR